MSRHRAPTWAMNEPSALNAVYSTCKVSSSFHSHLLLYPYLRLLRRGAEHYLMYNSLANFNSLFCTLDLRASPSPFVPHIIFNCYFNLVSHFLSV